MKPHHPLVVECIDTNLGIPLLVFSQAVTEALRNLCGGQYMDNGSLYHGVLMAEWRHELMAYSAVAIVQQALATACTPAELWHGIEALQAALYRRGGSGLIDGPAEIHQALELDFDQARPPRPAADPSPVCSTSEEAHGLRSNLTVAGSFPSPEYHDPQSPPPCDGEELRKRRKPSPPGKGKRSASKPPAKRRSSAPH